MFPSGRGEAEDAEHWANRLAYDNTEDIHYVEGMLRINRHVFVFCLDGERERARESLPTSNDGCTCIVGTRTREHCSRNAGKRLSRKLSSIL